MAQQPRRSREELATEWGTGVGSRDWGMGSRSLVADKRECGAWEIGNLTAGIASWASEFCEFSWLDFFCVFPFSVLRELGAGTWYTHTGETTTATVRGTWEDYECQINVNYKLPIKEAIKTGSTGQKK